MGDERVGLCLDCVHSRVVVSARGSRFYLCQLAERDARFRKYPPLPVVACTGYERTERDEVSADEA